MFGRKVADASILLTLTKCDITLSWLNIEQLSSQYGITVILDLAPSFLFFGERRRGNAVIVRNPKTPSFFLTIT